MPSISRPRYLRASTLTACFALALPVTFLVLAYLDFASPSWNPQEDSGAIQGYMFIGLVTALIAGFVSAVFPAVGAHLHRKGKLNITSLVKVLAIVLACASFALALAASLASDGLGDVLLLAVLVFSMSAPFLLPLAPLWLWLAQ